MIVFTECRNDNELLWKTFTFCTSFRLYRALEGEATEFLAVLQRGGYVRSFYEVIKERAGLGIVERIFITGVMSMTLDSMASGFNIATKITTEDDFTDMMGFRDDEEVKDDLLTLTYEKPRGPKEAVQLTTDEQKKIMRFLKKIIMATDFQTEIQLRCLIQR